MDEEGYTTDVRSKAFGMRNSQRASGNGHIEAKWLRLYETCLERASCLRRSMTRAKDDISFLLSSAFLGDVDKLRDACEMLMLGSTNELGRKGEEVMWRRCFYEHIQVLRQRRNELSSEAKQFVQVLITAASGYYLSLQERVKCRASAPLREAISETPIHFRWCTLSLEADSLDTWVLNTIYRIYLYLGDLARYKCEFDGSDFKEDYGYAERFYYSALSLKPKSGITYNQLGTLYAGANCNLDSVYYYFRCICSEEPFSGSEGNLLDLLQENELSFYQAERKHNAETGNVVGMLTPKLFILSSLRLFRLFYERSSANERTLIKYCDENLSLLQACFSMSLIGRFSVSGGTDPTGKTIIRVFSLMALLLKWLQNNDEPRAEAVNHWMASAFCLSVQHVIEAINRCFESHVKGAASCGAGKSSSEAAIVPSSKFSLEQITSGSTDEDTSVSSSGILDDPMFQYSDEFDEAVTSLLERRDSEYSLDALAGNFAVSEPGITVAHSLTPDEKLKLLSNLDWPVVLHVFCSWLLTDDILISYIGQHSPGIWGEFATMLNLLPTDDDLEAVIEQDGEIAQAVKTSTIFPLSAWHQTLPLDEDIYLYDILSTEFTEESTKIASQLRDKDQYFIRICCLKSFGHHLVEMKIPDFSYDEERQMFVAPFDFKAAQKLNRAKKQNLMKRMAQLKLKTDCARYRRFVERPMFLVPDAASLCHDLNMVQELLHSGEFVVVVSITVVDELDLWKKSMHQARRASRWLESELVNEAAHLKLQQREVRIRLCPRNKYSRINAPLEMVEACAYLRQKPGNESFTIALLTHHIPGSPPFEYMSRLVGEHRLTGVEVRHIKEFFDEWTASKLESV